MKKRIVNLTQHQATPEQKEDGVFDLAPEGREKLAALLTFDEPPTAGEICDRARGIADLTRDRGVNAAMIGGAPYLMSALENELSAARILPLYSFSRRESVDTPQPDGSVRKVATFKHAGWVRPPVV